MIKDIQFIRTRANFIRHSFIEEMERHLLAFETAINSNGIDVKWIVDERELVETVMQLLPQPRYNKVCFNLKKIPQEFLDSSPKIQVTSLENFEKNEDTAEIVFVEADYGIVDDASIVLVDNPVLKNINKINNLFILLNINDLIVKQNDLENILLLKYGDFDQIEFPKDIKIIKSSFKKIVNEAFAINDDNLFRSENVKITLFLYDNGVSTILEDPFLREALYCINCGKCAEVCPVYRHTNRFTPIELVKQNCFEENQKTQMLFQNTTLCGNCTEICPVQIPLNDLLIAEMERIDFKYSREKSIDSMRHFSKRSRMNKLSNKLRRHFYVRKYFGKNKKLFNYFNEQKEPFYNISQNAKPKPE